MLMLLPYAALFTAIGQNMNGFAYNIANPHPNGKFSGIYSRDDSTLKYFDVYSPPITTRYGQIYWTMMDAVPLPADVIARFANKTMAIRGYECNQVMKSPNGDIPVPINAAYNHHHTGNIVGVNARLVEKVLTPGSEEAMFAHGAATTWIAEDTRPPHLRTEGAAPINVALHEGNGGEFRQSYHGFPKGYAQLVHSPVTWKLQPMQIDTWNRENNYTASKNGGVNPFNMTSWPRGEFMAGPQPVNSWAPRHDSNPATVYSGLLECPCTDRITKVVEGGAATIKTTGDATCGGSSGADNFVDAKSCYAGAVASLSELVQFGLKITPLAVTENDPHRPTGCSVSITSTQPGSGLPRGFVNPLNATVFWNTDLTSELPCGAASATTKKQLTLWGGVKKSVTDDVGLNFQFNATTLLLTISAPQDVWVGVGFNASTMLVGTYAIVVDGDGDVSEHILGTESEGTTLPEPSSIEIAQTSVASGRRVTRLVVPLSNVTKTRVDFEELLATGALPIITALGSGKKFAYHASKSNHVINLFAIEEDAAMPSSSCLCPGRTASIPFGKGVGELVYTPVAGEPGGAGSSVPGSPKTSLHFAKNCLSYPGGTMLLGKNPSCDLRAYTGGQSCCHHLFTLLDQNQTTPWQDEPLVYHHKWRIWYDPTPVEDIMRLPLPADVPIIQNVLQFNWGGMASPTEYDVPKCGEGVYGCSRTGVNGSWVHTHNGTWQLSQMTSRAGAIPKGSTGVQWAVIHGHCHAPTCIEFELWNADANTLICRQTAAVGRSNKTFDEDGYLHIPPCVWGSEEEGLHAPLRLPFNTTLYGVKRCQADYGHHGEMSLWQTYGTYY